jgi:phosphoribosyl 1,2-cyclic phosphodiesterase
MNSAPQQMYVKFWGVRGSIPTPTSQNMGIGGNTSCLEVRLPDGHLIIVDGGTGARPLGAALSAAAAVEGRQKDLHVFLTHFHWDHIQGLPFFQPLYSRDNTVTFYSMKTPEETREILEGQMNVPYFPVDFRFLPAQRNFVAITEKPFHFGDTEVRNFPLNHPQGCHGYSFTHGGRKLVFASDLEHGVPEFDAILLEAAADADVLIFDAQFTPEEYEKRHGWGHSTWLQATEVAKQTRAKKLVLFHHDPGHSDEFMRLILAEARTHFPETYLAIEGESFFL